MPSLSEKAAYARAYREANRDRINTARREDRKKDPEKYRLADKRRYEKHGFARGLRAKYGLSLEEYNCMLIVQDYQCKICGDRFDESSQTCVDHDHTTGAVRALLCNSCNVLLGMAKECPNRLKQAIKYLVPA